MVRTHYWASPPSRSDSRGRDQSLRAKVRLNNYVSPRLREVLAPAGRPGLVWCGPRGAPRGHPSPGRRGRGRVFAKQGHLPVILRRRWGSRPAAGRTLDKADVGLYPVSLLPPLPRQDRRRLNPPQPSPSARHSARNGRDLLSTGWTGAAHRSLGPRGVWRPSGAMWQTGAACRPYTRYAHQGTPATTGSVPRDPRGRAAQSSP